MNPVDHSSGMVPLQGRYDAAPGQPGGPTVVHYTSVNVTAEPPKDHIIWSIFNFAWANFCCLGLAALVHSVKARDRKVVGDLEGARHYGSTARCLNIWATVLASITVFIFTCIIIAGAVQINNAYNTHHSYPRNNWGY